MKILIHLAILAICAMVPAAATVAAEPDRLEQQFTAFLDQVAALPEEERPAPLQVWEATSSLLSIPLESWRTTSDHRMALTNELNGAVAEVIANGQTPLLLALLEDWHPMTFPDSAALGSFHRACYLAYRHLSIEEQVAFWVAFADCFSRWTERGHTLEEIQWIPRGRGAGDFTISRTVLSSATTFHGNFHEDEFDFSHVGRLSKPGAHRPWLRNLLREALDVKPQLVEQFPLIHKWIEMLDDTEATAMEFYRLPREEQAR